MEFLIRNILPQKLIQLLCRNILLGRLIKHGDPNTHPVRMDKLLLHQAFNTCAVVHCLFDDMLGDIGWNTSPNRNHF
ncbi:MAG: hypothetical protein F3740_09990 [Nitrospinae bacterium]|nr:hypothetical protein [Nitrospinota bacterium]